MSKKMSRRESADLESLRQFMREYIASPTPHVHVIDPEAASDAAAIAALDPSLPARLWLVVGDRLGAALAPLVSLEDCRAALRARIDRA